MMDLGSFYFLKDEYFEKFPDKHLMRNIEMIEGSPHDRPCFYAFCEEKTGICWMIPFSSRVEKYKEEFNKKIQKSKDGQCHTILFGEILGHEKAFLVQNMCPILPQYVNNQYFDTKTSNPVKVNANFESQLIKSAKKVLALERNKRTNYSYIFPDVFNIERKLSEELKSKT